MHEDLPRVNKCIELSFNSEFPSIVNCFPFPLYLRKSDVQNAILSYSETTAPPQKSVPWKCGSGLLHRQASARRIYPAYI
jgi:hypothetical protein